MKMRESLIDSAAPVAPVAPIISDWRNLDAGARRALLARPAVPENTDLEQRVAQILAQVGRGGDGALRDLTRQHDGCNLQALEVEARDLDAADTQLPAERRRPFGRRRCASPPFTTPLPGGQCGLKPLRAWCASALRGPSGGWACTCRRAARRCRPPR